MKRKLILFTALVLILSMVAGVAGASISNIKLEPKKNGQIKVSWKDSGGSGPYTITWTNDAWNDWSAWDGEEFDGTSGSAKTMIPGVTYTVKVYNSSSSDTVQYKVPKSTFTDWTSGKRVTVDMEYFDVDSESIYKDVEVRFYYPRLKQERRYVWLLALKTPKGYASYVWFNEAFKIQPKYAYYYWNLDFSQWMENVRNCFGKIYTGDYAFEMYLDGKYYGSADFYVYGE